MPDGISSNERSSPAARSAARVAPRSRTRRAIYRVLTVILACLSIEAFARAVLAFIVGPSVLAYGTTLARRTLKPTKMAERPWHEQISRAEPQQIHVASDAAGYLKYNPHQRKTGVDPNGARYEVGINADGFRGEEFRRDKPPGVVRIMTLGASSTFGYHDRDDETYPHYLERLLNERLATHPDRASAYEVLNFGIPHLASANIVALFRAEGLAFAPDIVTFYEGVNDTRAIEPSGMERLLYELSQHFVVGQLVYQIATPLFTAFTQEALEEALRGKRSSFLANVALLRDECRSRGIRFIAISQQAQSETVPREELARTTYAEEVAKIQAKLDAGKTLSLLEFQLTIHSDLMQGLREWVATQDVEFVDAIAAFDRRGKRDTLVSWVHLAPEGNRILAEAIAEVVWTGRSSR